MAVRLDLGVRKLLDHAGAYRLFTRVLQPDGAGARRRFVDEFVHPRGGDRTLDIGCGPADILDLLPPCRYVGVDMNPAYIESAQRRYGARGTFLCGRVGQPLPDLPTGFDIVLAVGLIHHLNDREACDFFGTVKGLMAPSGRLITFDGVRRPGQSRLERFIYSMDRGKHVRHEDEYRKLASRFFPKIEATILTGLIRIPYTHLILACAQ